MSAFKALVVNKTDHKVTVKTQMLRLEDLPEGDLLIHVDYSSVNYKDALACVENGQIVKQYPFVPGIDLAGTVVESGSKRYRAGDEVIVTGYGLGVSHFGGFSEYARVPSEWALKLPEGLTLREAMILGTAGLTAALSVRELRQNGIYPESGPVLVTGASGGVGSISAAILAKLGYEVTASTGKADMHDSLHGLGVKHIMSREELLADSKRALGKQLWAGAVDCVGGATLSAIMSKIKYGGAVAASGVTGGADLALTVFPFIIRGVKLLGIDSVMVAMDKRMKVWELLAGTYKPDMLDDMCKEIRLEQLGDQVEAMLGGESRGRMVVKL